MEKNKEYNVCLKVNQNILNFTKYIKPAKKTGYL